MTEHVLFDAGRKALENNIKLERLLWPSWGKTSYISYSLQNNCLPYERIHPIRHKPEVTNALHNLAFINVGKQVGGKTTSASRLAKLYQQNSSLLHKQIQLCQANVIIGWNTLDLFERDAHFKALSKDNSTANPKGGICSWFSNGVLFIAAGHPAARGISAKSYVNAIVDIVREHAHALDKTLPTWSV